MGRELARIPIKVSMREGGRKESFMGKEGLYGPIIHNIMEIIHSGRKVEKELSPIHREKSTKEVGFRENNKEKELFSVLQDKSSKKVHGAMEHS